MSNPAGNYNRVKTWGSADTILGSDLNAEFDNILNNFNPEMLAAYSQNQAQMQIQTSPGGVGSESLATAISGELERLRYMLSSITGNTYWYQSPASNIAQLTSAIGTSALNNSITSGLTNGTTGSSQPIFLLAANTTNTVTLKAGATPFVYKVAGSTYTIAVDTPVTGLSKAPASSNTVTVSDLAHVGASSTQNKLYGENGGTITTTSMGTLSLTSGELYCFKTTAGEYLLARYQSTTQLVDVRRGFFFDSTNALVSRGTLANGDTLTLMKLNYIFATTGATLTSYSGTSPLRVGGVAPSSPNAGDYWFDTSANYWKLFAASTWSNANATLIGVAACDSSNCVVTRSYDFFENYSSLNTIELFTDEINSATKVRSRQTGGQLSVYGTTLQYGADYAYWDFTTDLDTGAIAASTYYYLYVNIVGKSIISLTAPTDRRSDLFGFYHPGNTYRCVGYCFVNALTLVQEVESFFRSDITSSTSNITAAQATPAPYNIIPLETTITLSGTVGAFTQVLPPPYMWKGKTLTYIKTDNTLNAITLQAWGNQIASTTGTLTLANSTISTVGSTAGIATGQLLTGMGIAPNTTVTAVSAGAVTMSNGAQITAAGITFTTANAAGYSGTVGGQTNYAQFGINGGFTTTLNTQYESVNLYSDGFAVFIVSRYIPAIKTFYTPTLTGFNSVTVLTCFSWRVGKFLHVEAAWTSATVSAVTAQFSMGFNGTNANVFIDTTFMGSTNQIVGSWASNLAGGQGEMLYFNSSTAVGFSGLAGQAVAGNAVTTASALINSAGTMTCHFRVPIAGWND